MRTRRVPSQGLIFTIISTFALATALTADAQIDPTVPVVSVRVPDPLASEGGDPGRFVLLRDGPTNLALNVYCVFGGTASNGMDYTTIPNFISIPAGVRETLVPVHPIEDSLAEGIETVVLRLAPSPLMSPINYIIGNPSNAAVTITEQAMVAIAATDPVATEIPLVPPWLDIPQRIDPGVFTVYRAGSTNVPLDVSYTVSGTASDGVDYEALSGSVKIPAGVRSVTIAVMPIDDLLIEETETVKVKIDSPMCLAIYPPPPGCYQVGTSNVAVVHIMDNDSSSNLPPEVKITKPLDGQTFVSPTNVLIVADTVDVDGYVPRVEFFANNVKIGERERHILVIPPPGQHAAFEFVWTNPPVGRHILTARATDNEGATGLSHPTTIWVVNTNLPPPPPLVTITATDAIASEGTNCYQIAIYPPPTNNPCVSNTATFVIRRAGPTNSALTVHYCISGTASNGVDYVELPGVVTIPAGRRAVEFKVVPIDDNVREKVETVVLRLCVPPTASVAIPPYLIGCPGRAAAIIVDNDEPRPGIGLLPDGCFHLLKPGAEGTWWRIECSADMNQWTPIGTVPVTDGAIDFVDPDADELPSRFYRAVLDSSPPPD